MKTTFIETSTSSGKFYKLRVSIWGDETPRAKTLVCVHGLTGNSMDFKYLGENLSSFSGYRVAAIDMAGRGESDDYDDPKDYNFDQYIKDLNVFLKTLGCTAPASCDWLGVSMGGLLGMRISGIENSPIRNMILVDVGPEVPQKELDHIAQYITINVSFDTLEEVVPLLKMALGSPYSRGEMTEEMWLHFAATYYKKNSEGKYARNMDSKIADIFKTEPLGTVDLWNFWKETKQPVLSVRGELSTLFTEEIAEKMEKTKTGAPLDRVTMSGCGHVPSLFRDDQISVIARWLADRMA